MIVVGRGDAGRVIDARQFLVGLLLGLLDAALDVAYRLEILDELDPIALPERTLQTRDLLAD